MSQIPKLPKRPVQDLTPGWFESWYLDLETWHKSVFGAAIEVEAILLPNKRWYASQGGCLQKTHTALLINIQPTKEESAEDILREWVMELESVNGLRVDHLEKAKAFLERKK